MSPASEKAAMPQNKRRGSDGFAALKLDMSKAYERVEWGFLARMMLKLGFHQNWVNVVMEFVTTVSYRVRINGDLMEDIKPQRAWSEAEDPLSPYLFLICAKAFSCLMNGVEARGDMEGVRVSYTSEH